MWQKFTNFNCSTLSFQQYSWESHDFTLNKMRMLLRLSLHTHWNYNIEIYMIRKKNSCFNFSKVWSNTSISGGDYYLLWLKKEHFFESVRFYFLIFHIESCYSWQLDHAFHYWDFPWLPGDHPTSRLPPASTWPFLSLFYATINCQSESWFSPHEWGPKYNVGNSSHVCHVWTLQPITKIYTEYYEKKWLAALCSRQGSNPRPIKQTITLLYTWRIVVPDRRGSGENKRIWRK